MNKQWVPLFIVSVVLVVCNIICMVEINFLKYDIEDFKELKVKIESGAIPMSTVMFFNEHYGTTFAEKSHFKKLLSILYTDNIISYDDFLLLGGDPLEESYWDLVDGGAQKITEVSESFLLNKDKITMKMLCDYLNIELVKTCEEEKIELKPKTRGKNENN